MPTPTTSPAQAPTPPAVPPVPPVQGGPVIAGQVGPAPSLDALMGQERVLQEQLNVLLAQRVGLGTQLRLIRGGDRAGVMDQIRDVNAQIAKTSGDLANVKAQIAMRQGRPVPQTMEPPTFPAPAGRRGGIDQDNVTAVIIVFMLAVLMPISIGITRRLWRRTPKDNGAPLSDLVSPRLERLEQAVDAIAIEIERISEGQRFVTKVLVERPGSIRQPAPADASAEPFRALGAGPIEPIRMPERQAVRPSITPH
ncbi:MAG: hypothetical protein JWM41_812 [Gemmatimonadetes bacterium]|nr:hypothetical protein [Gemmatimonadota bacterium]